MIELIELLNDRYRNEDFKKECTEEYLAQRSAYRLHGKKAPMKAKESEMF